MKEPNLSYIQQLSNGNEAFENRIFEVLNRELPQEIDEFNGHMDRQELVLAADLVHKIKHKVSLLGMEKGYHTTVNFEEELRNGKTLLYEDFQEVLKKMVTFLADINNTGV